MTLIRWFLTFTLVFAATIFALVMLALLLIAFGVLQFARLASWVRVAPAGGPLSQARSTTAPAQPRAPDLDLPEAPPGASVQHVRSWDAARNRAVDRWYYKDAQGQWVFVRAPGTA
ncbi:hypothetical protein [Terrarubrum flagellatum]|uniref:hypothetical protein n=1 Tax=Terrirubrum flagellatum TaxID=2895980 RepID=UPI00314534A4